jgi:oligopeptide/dipeptide ABC transporter ATP-binding protein
MSATTETAIPLIALDDVVVSYPATGRGTSAVLAADHVHLHVVANETVGLVGESGSGKSTVARVAALLQRPTSGGVRVGGVDGLGASRGELKALRRRMQVVFQDPYDSLNPRHTIGDAIAEPLIIQGVGDAGTRDRRVEELLVQVGLPTTVIGRYPHQLSGGQLQRVAIARALSVEPEILILDEPVSALDVSVQAQVLALLATLHRDLGLAYLLVAHDLAVVYRLCDRIAVMYFGGVVEELSSEDLVQYSLHPYTWSLLDAVPSVERYEQVDATASIEASASLDGTAPLGSGCRFANRCAYATDLCRTEVPPLRAVGRPGQAVACHYAGQLQREVLAAGSGL